MTVRWSLCGWVVTVLGLGHFAQLFRHLLPPKDEQKLAGKSSPLYRFVNQARDKGKNVFYEKSRDPS
jgi:hypothetical protein